ncbi:tail spike receptor binding N-terminal domain protein [Flyfo podovirus Tbat2_2]|nr:tail spike receptor binding N-terminal domain protein [Flyfo podovirus Tbat2_2]
MSDCKSYVSKEDLQALKESQQHIEHVARSRNAAGEKALQVTDAIRGENVTNRTLDGLEDLYTSSINNFETRGEEALSSVGWVTLDSFQQGAEITERNQVLRDEITGEYYRWDGDLPKVVPVGSTPASAGGVGTGAWVSIGDASVRSFVKQYYSESFYTRMTQSFSSGATVSNDRESIFNVSDGFYYTYTGDGSFPVSVPAGSSPDGDWTCVYSAVDNLETVCFSDAIAAGEMHPLKITTIGYHAGSDIGGNEFVPSGTGTPGDTDHGSFFVTSKGVKYQSTSPISWATQFGATKDGGREDVINAAIARMSQWSSFGIDPGIKFNNPLIASVVGMTFTGRGIHSELTTFNQGAAFVVTSEYITFENMNVKGVIEIADNNAFILDSRTYARADFDVFVKNCRVGNFRYCVSTKGRGVEISECVFSNMETLLKISVPDIDGFEDGTTVGQKYPNAFRTYYITNNRLHSVYGFVIENLGVNAHVAKGFLITGNISDGLCGGLNGYFKNLDWSGNNFGAINQITSARPALFELWSPDCVNISGSFTGYPASTDASGNPVEQQIYQSVAKIHDAKSVKFDVSVAQYGNHGFSIDGTSVSIDINVNGNSSLGNGRSVVKLENNASVKNLKVSGLIDNVNLQEKVYLSAGSNVTVGSMDLAGFMVSNRVANESISDIPPANPQNIGNRGTSYTGNGAASMNVVLDASPKSVTIFGGGKGIFKAHYQIPGLTSNVTFNRRTIAVKGDCNASGQLYYVEYD